MTPELFASSTQISDAVNRVAKEIERDHPGEPPVFVGVLKGSLPFLADLARACELDAEIDLLAISQFGHEAKQGGVVRILKDLDSDIHGRHVVLVEDIVDTGLTLSYLLRMLKARAPASIRVATLLERPAAKGSGMVDYVGIEAPEGFIVGYGLDLDGVFRNLRNLWILESASEVMNPDQVAELYKGDSAI